MRPGRKPTPQPILDLKRLWAELGEDPPGPIVQAATKPKPRPKTARRRAA